MTTVDYLRIATWDLPTYLYLSAQIRLKYPPNWTGRHWLQYNGYGNPDGYFYGSGDQGDERHHIFHASGTLSHHFFNFIMGLGIDKSKIYCTRLDIQQTIRHPDINLRKLYKGISRTAKTWVESDSITIYVGARTSDRYTRLYQKINAQYLRLEFELKGKLARTIFATCLTQSNHEAILQNQFVVSARKSKLGAAVLTHFDLAPNILSQKDASFDEDYTRSLKRRMEYISNTEVALLRYLADHDTAERVRQLVDLLHRVCILNLDNENNMK